MGMARSTSQDALPQVVLDDLYTTCVTQVLNSYRGANLFVASQLLGYFLVVAASKSMSPFKKYKYSCRDD